MTMTQRSASQPSILPPKRRFASFRSISALVLREMSTSYGRSPGGYVWVIIEPVAGILLFSLVLSYLVRSPPLGSSFLLFYATGILPFMLYQSVSSKVGTAIQFSRPLLAYPSVTYADAIFARLILEVMTQIVVGFLILTVIIAWTGEYVKLDFGKISMAVLMATAVGAGIGLLNSFLTVMIPIWVTVWAVLNRPMFLISGIFFLVDPLSERYRDVLLLNPLVHIISEMRSGFYVTYDAVYVSPLYVFVFAILPAVLGLILLHRYHNDILEV